MQYTKLGNSELNISRICMGVWGLGMRKTGSIPGPSIKSTPVRLSGRVWNWA